jgi:hypothetical protein
MTITPRRHLKPYTVPFPRTPEAVTEYLLTPYAGNWVSEINFGGSPLSEKNLSRHICEEGFERRALITV